MSDAVLEHYGTKAFTLKPGSIAQAAIADIGRFASNKSRRRGDYEHYAFVQAHVHKAMRSGGTASALIAYAIDHRDDGLTSGKKHTRMIYSDLRLMCGALLEVEKREGK